MFGVLLESLENIADSPTKLMHKIGAGFINFIGIWNKDIFGEFGCPLTARNNTTTSNSGLSRHSVFSGVVAEVDIDFRTVVVI